MAFRRKIGTATFILYLVMLVSSYYNQDVGTQNNAPCFISLASTIYGPTLDVGVQHWLSLKLKAIMSTHKSYHVFHIFVLP